MRYLLLSFYLLFAITGWSQGIDRSFGPRTLSHTNPLDVATASDGSVFMTGALDYVNGHSVGKILKLKPDGQVDGSFKVKPGFDVTTLQAILPLPDGKVIAAGEFRYFGASGHSAIVQLNADGSVDTNFDPPYWNVSGAIRFLAVGRQSDGKIIVTGELIGTNQNVMRRLNPNGSLDNSFVLDYYNTFITSITVLPDDKIIIAGNFQDYNNVQGANDIVRLNADGSFDDTFNANLPDDWTKSVRKVQRLPSGSFVLDILNGDPVILNSDGSPDDFFDGGAIGGYSAAALSDGSVIVQQMNGILSEYNAEGELVSSMNNPVLGEVFSFGDDKILAPFHSSDPIVTHRVFNSDLTINEEMNPLILLETANELKAINGSKPFGRQLAQQPDGKLLVQTFGEFYSNGSSSDLHEVNVIFRLNEDLSFDDSFKQNLFNPYYPVDLKFVDKEGRIYLNQQIGDWWSGWSLIRLDQDGTQDMSFSSVPGWFTTITELKDSNFLASKSDEDKRTSKIVRFDASGANVHELVAFDTEVNSVNEASDGNWFVTLNFVQTLSNAHVIKYSPDGIAIPSFTGYPPLSTYETSTAEIYKDHLYVAGEFVNNSPTWGTMAFQLEIWGNDGIGRVNQDESLKYRIGKDLEIDRDNGDVYVLSNELMSLNYEVRRFKSDGNADKRFRPVRVSREYTRIFTSKDRLFLMPDKSLVIAGDTVYHLVLPELPKGADNVVLSTSKSSITITWSDNSDNETVFEIERSTDGGKNYYLVGTVDENITTFTDQKLADGTYTYRVLAANARGVSEDYEDATAEIAPPATVTGLENESGFKIFPNPFASHLQVQSSEPIDNFSVRQLDGRLLQNANPSSNDFKINMNDYAPGLYILQLESIAGKRIIKIYKQ